MTASGAFSKWLRGVDPELRTLVVCGCTTTSCVRVSSQQIKAAHPQLEVVVDLSLCGARAANHEPSAERDPDLLRIYGRERCRGASAVDLAVYQMRQAGVVVVDRYTWRPAES